MLLELAGSFAAALTSVDVSAADHGKAGKREVPFLPFE